MSFPAQWAQDAARKGARLLDGHIPDWFLQIRRQSLDLGCCTQCILGQLFRHFVQGRDKLEEWDEIRSRILQVPVTQRHLVNVLEEYGFDVWSENRYHDLTEAWLQEIQERINRHNQEIQEVHIHDRTL